MTSHPTAKNKAVLGCRPGPVKPCDGACGENLLNDEELPPKAARELAEGDVVTVRTPGGGGYGSPA